MSTVKHYIESVTNRVHYSIEPPDFKPDFADRPRTYKFYPEIEPLPLPELREHDSSRLSNVLFAPLPHSGKTTSPRFDLHLLASMLRESYGELARRLAVHANPDFPALNRYADAVWSRGTASGGGLYPVNVYWINGTSGPLRPGVQYYAPKHHALQQLLSGDVTPIVRDALGYPGLPCDQYLVLGVKFWQNAFKYHNFSYHAVTMDVGALLETWRLWSKARGMTLRPALWFDEARLSTLLNLAPEDEGIFAVVPLPWQGGPPAHPGAPPPDAHVRATEQERSKRPATFPMLRAVHRATAANNQRPARDAAAMAAITATGGGHSKGNPVTLPVPDLLSKSLGEALRTRRSSFGRFTAIPALSQRSLGTVLASTMPAAAFPCDATGDLPGALVRLYVFINHVEGIRPGSYAFDPQIHALWPVSTIPPGTFLQDSYFLNNYNLNDTAAVIVAAARPTAALDAMGDRAYRLVNAAIGAVAQAAYITCASARLGCGAALGFDNTAYINELGLAGSDEVPLLIILIGNERTDTADYHYSLERRDFS
ncbi:nitroreductase family protein [Streptomyces sp. NPDC127084]|uniref:nitroreductase family protein n=1 Tax=Streptomyces sp. NPDC127084 TaxID=3347133 RepID=UPI00364BCE0F